MIGLGLFIYSLVENSDTVEVNASYQEENCQTDIRGKYETKNGKREWVRRDFTLCDYTVSYEIDGQLYEEKLTQVNKNSIKPGKRWVEHKREGTSGSFGFIGIIMMVFGVFAIAGGVVSAIGNRILEDIGNRILEDINDR